MGYDNSSLDISHPVVEDVLLFHECSAAKKCILNSESCIMNSHPATVCSFPNLVVFFSPLFFKNIRLKSC